MLLKRQIWGHVPESLVLSSIKGLAEFLVFPPSLLENFGMSGTVFENGVYAKSNSPNTYLSYNESTQLELSSTSFYAHLWPTIQSGGIYFGYNWENEEHQNYKIPVYVADIGLIGRLIFFNLIYDGGGSGSGGGDSSSQTIGENTGLPPTIQNTYNIDYGPKISEFTEARVKIQLNQQLTLEREAFEASAQLTNKLDSNLNNISISLNIEDEYGINANDKFFVQSPNLININSINGDGIIQPLNTTKINWNIIPHTDSGGTTESGKIYSVQMHIEGNVNGTPFIADSEKANITVKPQPNLNLTYYLPKEIVANQPFHLAVKVNNSGYGWGRDVKILSAQPEIIENNAGLLLDFTISSSLLVDFGDIAPGEEKIKYWTLESSVPGTFSNFSATFTHKEELGGDATSLIKGVNTEFLDRELSINGLVIPYLVDKDNDNKPDTIVDLASNQEFMLETPTILLIEPDETNLTQRVLTSKPQDQWVSIEIPDIFNGDRTIRRIYRADGVLLNPMNYWIENNKVIIIDDPDTDYTILYNSTSSGNYSDENSTNISISDYLTSNGEILTVPIIIDVNDPSGLATATIDLMYNSSVVNVLSVNNSDFEAFIPNIDNNSGKVRMVAYQTGISGLGPGEVNFADVTLQAIGNYSESSQLNLSIITLKNNSGIAVPFNTFNGTFKISLIGDFSGDEEVDSWDITYLARHIAGITGYEQITSGDVSGDGIVDSWDCTYLARAIAGVPGYSV